MDVDVDVAGLSRADGLVVLGAGNAAGWLQEAARRLWAGGDDAAGGEGKRRGWFGSGRVKIFHSLNKGSSRPGGVLRVGFFVTWLKGKPYKGRPCLVRALFVGWVGVGGRSVLLRVPWSGSAKVPV